MSWNAEIYEREYNRFFRGFRLQHDHDNPRRVSARASQVFYEAQDAQNYEKCKAMIDAYHDAVTLPPNPDEKIMPIYDGIVHRPDDLDVHGERMEPYIPPFPETEDEKPTFNGSEDDKDLLFDISLALMDDYLAGKLTRDDLIQDFFDLLDDYENARRD